MIAGAGTTYGQAVFKGIVTTIPSKKLHLTLEQHVFKMDESTYMQIFLVNTV